MGTTAARLYVTPANGLTSQAQAAGAPDTRLPYSPGGRLIPARHSPGKGRPYSPGEGQPRETDSPHTRQDPDKRKPAQARAGRARYADKGKPAGLAAGGLGTSYRGGRLITALATARAYGMTRESRCQTDERRAFAFRPWRNPSRSTPADR